MVKTTSSVTLRHAGGDAQPAPHEVLEAFGGLTDRQFDYWLDQLNKALASLGVDHVFNRDDHRTRTISYWYVIGTVVTAAVKANPTLAQPAGITASPSDEIITGMSVKKLYESSAFQMYEKQTIRRFLSELRKLQLFDTAGKGEDGLAKVPVATVAAYLNTVRNWRREFGAWQAASSGMFD